MPKNPVTGWFHDPISAVLGTRGKVAVLRVLVQAQTALVQREVARRTGMALRTVELAVDDLMTAGLVERIPGGRERLIQLRTSHRLAPSVQALLRAGADFWPALRTELRSLAATAPAGELLAVSIVGRASRREEKLGDPLDLLILTESEDSAEAWVRRYGLLAEGMLRRFGVAVRPIGYDLASARRMWAARTKAAERSVLGGEWVHGAEVGELLNNR